MLKFIKNIVQKVKSLQPKEQSPEALTPEEVDRWFHQKVSALHHRQMIIQYYNRISKIKSQLKDNILDLEQAEISKEHKNVQERIKNIVLGHREKYCREIRRLTECLDIPKHEDVSKQEEFNALKEFQEARQFNESIDQRIEELAQRTAKSYQASQHLFFKETESLFKTIGELNILVRNFKEKSAEIEELVTIQDNINQLKEEMKKRKQLNQEILKKEDETAKLQRDLEEKEKVTEKLKNSQEHQDYLALTEKEKKCEEQLKAEEQKIFEFFSKLNKPLRKYEHVALDDKLIKKYAEDSVRAFQADPELKIKEVLQGLNQNLERLNLDERTRKNSKELIQKSEEKYLDGIKEAISKLNQEQMSLIIMLKENKVIKEIEQAEEEIKKLQQQILFQEHSMTEVRSKVKHQQTEELTRTIKEMIHHHFNTDIEINTTFEIH